MNPVVGLDVSKGESQVQAFMDKRQPFRKSFSVKHTVEGFENLLGFLKEIERVADGKKPSVILESTAHSCYSIFGGTAICLYYCESPYLSPCKECKFEKGKNRRCGCLSSLRTILQRRN